MSVKARLEELKSKIAGGLNKMDADVSLASHRESKKLPKKEPTKKTPDQFEDPWDQAKHEAEQKAAEEAKSAPAESSNQSGSWSVDPQPLAFKKSESWTVGAAPLHPELEKGIKELAAGAAMAAGLVSASPISANQEKPAPVQVARPELHEELKHIAFIESSSGKNKGHMTVKRGLNRGHTAGGSTGLMPLTIKDIVRKNPSLHGKYGHLQTMKPDEITDFTNKNEHAETEIANAHWDRLSQIFPKSPSRRAYAWRRGVTAAKEASDEKVESHPYVKKFNQLKGASQPLYAQMGKSEGLEKGKNGDWEKEGYAIKATPYHGEHHYSQTDKNIPIKNFKTHDDAFHLIVKTYDNNGQEVGHVETSQSGNRQAIEGVHAHDAHQRKGLASAMYRHIEDNYSSIDGSAFKTSDGKALCSQPNRKFGKSQSLGHALQGPTARVGAQAQASVSIPKDAFIEEHERLINVLESPSHEDDEKEAKKQKKELAEQLEKGFPVDISKSHILMFPVSINGKTKDEHEDLPDYHLTLKWMGDQPHKSPEEIEHIVKTHGIRPPENVQITPHQFNTKRGEAHVLLVHGLDESAHACKSALDEGKPDPQAFTPHITVSKHVHDQVRSGRLKAGDLGIKVHPLEYRVGNQVVRRFDELKKTVRSPRQGHTLGQMRRLKDMGWHNPDTGTEIAAEEGEEHLWRLEQNRADKLVEAQTKQFEEKPKKKLKLVKKTEKEKAPAKSINQPLAESTTQGKKLKAKASIILALRQLKALKPEVNWEEMIPENSVKAKDLKKALLEISEQLEKGGDLTKAREDKLVPAEHRKTYRKARREFEGKDELQNQVTPVKGVSDVGIEVRRADAKVPGAVAHGYSRVSSPEKHKAAAKEMLVSLRDKIKNKSLEKSSGPLKPEGKVSDFDDLYSLAESYIKEKDASLKITKPSRSSKSISGYFKIHDQSHEHWEDDLPNLKVRVSDHWKAPSLGGLGDPKLIAPEYGKIEQERLTADAFPNNYRLNLWQIGKGHDHAKMLRDSIDEIASKISAAKANRIRDKSPK